MKNIILLVFIVLAASCNKSSNVIQNNGLPGKWQLTEYFTSSGNGGSWHPADNSAEHTIEFRNDRSFASSDSAYNGAIGFNIIDSNRVEFILPTQIPSVQSCFYKIEDNGKTLILSPDGCIEGCYNKYKAIQSNVSTN